MPDQHGDWVWYELMTPDADASAAFYGKVVGWTVNAPKDKYFETPHYAGWPAMLVRLDAVSDEDLANRLECAWKEKAPAKLRKEQ